MLVLDQLNLLRHDDVDLPETRGFFLDGRQPHGTAVLVEENNGTKWSIDSWSVGYGRALEIMPLGGGKASIRAAKPKTPATCAGVFGEIIRLSN